MTKRRGKGGFTLVELAVTLVIMSILFAIAVPNLLGYIHLSQFRRNESCAKTMYLSAESALTYCRTGGEWESFRRRVKDEGVLNRSFDEADGEQKKLSGRIYGVWMRTNMPRANCRATAVSSTSCFRRIPMTKAC